MINFKGVIMYLKNDRLKRIVQFLAGMFGTLFLLTCLTFQVNASQLNFSVDPVLPENQYHANHTYFDLMVAPNQTQELVINMKNDTKKEVIVIPEIHPATTNINGVVEYGESSGKLDDSAPFNIQDVLTSEEEEIVIPAEGEKVAKFHLVIPNQPFQGIVAGGITLKEKDTEEKSEQSEETQGLAIENKYAYVIATVLRETEEVSEKSLTLVDVAADQVNARNVINATLQNTQADYLNQLEVQTKVKRKGSDEVLYSTTKNNMQMAPNTSFDFPTKLEGKKLEAGDYVLELAAKSGEKKWSFSKQFTITSKKADDLNKKDVTIGEDHKEDYALIGLGVIILLLIGIVLVYLLKKGKRTPSNLDK